jgi:hypothetical protein
MRCRRPDVEETREKQADRHGDHRQGARVSRRSHRASSQGIDVYRDTLDRQPPSGVGEHPC